MAIHRVLFAGSPELSTGPRGTRFMARPRDWGSGRQYHGRRIGLKSVGILKSLAEYEEYRRFISPAAFGC